VAAEIRDRLREARVAKGWTQEQAAHAIGVSMMTVSRWERGEHVPGGE
jgi:transcriptional regulator with XRE-family HTH domain